MANLSRKAAIVGVDESDEIGKIPNKSRLQHGSEAAINDDGHDIWLSFRHLILSWFKQQYSSGGCVLA